MTARPALYLLLVVVATAAAVLSSFAALEGSTPLVSDVERRPWPRHPGYLAGADGSVRGPSGRILRTYQDNDGRLSFGVRRGGRTTTVRVHVVVAEAWHGPRPAGTEAAHGNGDNSDNRPCNDKRLHGTVVRGEKSHLSRLTEEAIRAIRAQYATGQYSHEDLGAAFDVAPATIGLALQGRTWAHVADGPGPLSRPRTVNRGERNARARLTEAAVHEIRAAHAGGESISALARQFNVARTAIQSIIWGRTWRHVQ